MKIDQPTSAPCILVAPLNWGLGHATRSMPIIDELKRQGAKVIIASDGRALHLLKKEYPDLTCLELPPYDVRYSAENLMFTLALQVPKILWAIWREQYTIQKIVNEYDIKGIISDNRFGCRSNHIPSIFITHQINLITPHLLGLGAFVRWCNRRMIRRFDECWIPDFEGSPNLSGKLSHGHTLSDMRYIGALSRMKKKPTTKRYDIVAVLSGPEPQRTYLEEKIVTQLQKLPYSALIIQGKTDNEIQTKNDHIETISYLTTDALTEALLAAEVVITRSGYTTLMDLAALGKQKVILIPTPEQTEQVYLAEEFDRKKIYLSQPQSRLNIEKALVDIKQYSGLDITLGEENLREAVSAFLRSANEQ